MAIQYNNLYIHVPFCRNKCDYCGFYSTAAAKEDLMVAWLDKIIEQYWREMAPQIPETVFVGGGTPTLLPGDLLKRFCEVTLSAEKEISMESNPETLTPDKFAILTDNITRLSLGVQSFDQDFRRILGRCTSDRAINSAINLAKNSKLSFNIDLIYGIPRQTLKDWQEELKRVIDCGVNHVSCYNLTIEEGTLLAERAKIDAIADDDLAADMWYAAGEILGQAGIKRYEISNYAKPGAECRHNLNIWRGENYLGLGPSASSFDGINRWVQKPDIDSWLKGEKPETDAINAQMRRDEIFAFGLRTVEGWKRSNWKYPGWDKIRAKMAKMDFPPGIIKISPDQIRLTEKGLLLWDAVAESCLMM